MPKSCFFDFKGNKIHYVSSGEGNSVILLPPGVSSWKAYEGIIDELSSSGFRAFAVDLPGRGKTVYQGEPCGLKVCHEIVAAFIQNERVSSPAFIGASYGGMVLIELLKRKEFSSAKVVLLETGRPFSEPLRKVLEVTTAPAVRFEKPRRLYRRVLAKVWDEGMLELRPDQYQVIADCWKDLLSWKPEPNPNFSGDILAIIGWKDLAIDNPVTEEMFPKALFRTKLLPNVHHKDLFDHLGKSHFKDILDFLK